MIDKPYIYIYIHVIRITGKDNYRPFTLITMVVINIFNKHLQLFDYCYTLKALHMRFPFIVSDKQLL